MVNPSTDTTASCDPERRIDRCTARYCSNVPTTQTVRGGTNVVVLDTTARRRERRWPSLVIATVLFAVAYDDGGYGLSARSVFAVCLWWAIILGVALGLFPRTSGSQAVHATAALLAAFTLWTLASTL